jgi:hypothetical protein
VLEKQLHGPLRVAQDSLISSRRIAPSLLDAQISRALPTAWAYLRRVTIAIFNRIVAQAREAGLVHDRLRIIDATHLAAKVDLFRLPPNLSGDGACRSG